MGFMDDARLRARRRRSAWNLLLIPAVVLPWLAASWLTWSALGRLYRILHPTASFAVLPDSVGGILMAIAPLFAWIPLAMVAGNLLVRMVPTPRSVLDAEAASVPGTDFRSANRGLVRAAAVLFPSGLLVSLIGLLF